MYTTTIRTCGTEHFLPNTGRTPEMYRTFCQLQLIRFKKALFDIEISKWNVNVGGGLRSDFYLYDIQPDFGLLTLERSYSSLKCEWCVKFQSRTQSPNYVVLCYMHVYAYLPYFDNIVIRFVTNNTVSPQVCSFPHTQAVGLQWWMRSSSCELTTELYMRIRINLLCFVTCVISDHS